MRIADANVLLNAVNPDAGQHAPSRRWLEAALGGRDTVGLTWIAMVAFLRISTSATIMRRPLTVARASQYVDSWIQAKGAVVVHAATDHERTLNRLLERVGRGGNLVNDAHLAAIAIEQRASVVSWDSDFARFAGVRWERPDELV